MADEQIIYLGPDEELTNVRERLEKTQARRIILVIPTQTQLRSHLSWRLLHSRMRELNKDVLVISSDRQIRAVVKAAGFRVADSQESPASGGTRPSSHPSRSSSGGRTPGRVRDVPGPGSSTGRTAKGTPDRGSSTDIRRREQPARTTPDKQSSPPQEPVSRVDDQSESGMSQPIPSPFGTQDTALGPGYDYRIETPPSSFSAKPEQEDDEPDQLVADYNVAQSIRRAAEQGKIDAGTNPPEGQPPPPHVFNEVDQDPFAFTEDRYPSPLPEQRGRSPLEELDEGIPDISNYPTSVLSPGDIEDLGDEGDIVKPAMPSPRSWSQPVLEEPEAAESSRIYGVRPRSNRQGNVPRVDEDKDELPPIADQATRAAPPPRRVTTPLPYSRTRTPTPQPQAQPPAPAGPRTPASATPAAPQRGTGRPVSTAGGVAARMPARTAPAGRARTGGMSIGLITFVAIILFLLVAGLLIYYVPSADVTVTIPSQTYSAPLALTATANSQQDVVLHTVAATTLVFDTSVTGTGPASGSKKVGTTPATGTVNFTNNGNKPVDIPTGTTVATSDGKNFATTVDALVLNKGNPVGNSVPVQVQAQVQGTDGNVPSNSITVIPNASLASIRQANPGVQVNLTVTNPRPFTNGGVGNATTVASSDIAKLKANLEPQAQQRANAWLAQQVHAGDVQGKPVQQETVTATPNLGQVTPSGTFMGRLSLHMTVLVVRAADLQAAAQAEFNAAVMKAKANYALVPQQKVNLEKTSSKACTPVSSETSIMLCYTATGQIAPQVSEQKIRDLVVGKPVQAAESDLKSSIPGSSGRITISPGFFPLMPWQSQRISVHFKVVPAPITPKR